MLTNVDTNKGDPERVIAFWTIAKQVITDIDGQATNDNNVMRFLLHVAWHEGNQLHDRKQIGGGPGRGFSQFEPPRAREAVEYADAKDWLDTLAAAVRQTDDTVLAEAKKISGAAWPGGGLVEKWLADPALASDYFNVLLTRIALRKIPQPIGSSLSDHSKYWADHWKIQFEDDDDRDEKMKQFVANAQKADTLIPIILASTLNQPGAISFALPPG